MKKTIIASLFVLAMIFGADLQAQKFSGIDKSPADIAYFRPEKNAAPLVKVIYSRPQLKDRTVGIDLAPYGEVWRTGANEATEIKFYQNTVFGDKTIEAGTYSLFSIPGKDEWTIILSKDLDVWGAYSYNPSNDALRITVKPSTGEESLEAFSITFAPNGDSGAQLVMGWDTTRVAIPLSYEY
ncbi:DUF2911 domain-containing protein [Galbibacter sp.]|jgi:hypothetical protein|uniref:DUF2911 domain-containing protein n=1 Tax=Galbibacter sp. TaxID=2918471 RepID=UPI003A8CAA06